MTPNNNRIRKDEDCANSLSNHFTCKTCVAGTIRQDADKVGFANLSNNIEKNFADVGTSVQDF